MMLPKSFAVCAKVHKVSGTLQEPECLFVPTWEGSEVPLSTGKHHIAIGYHLWWKTALGAWLVSSHPFLLRGGPAVSISISLGRCQQLSSWL